MHLVQSVKCVGFTTTLCHATAPWAFTVFCEVLRLRNTTRALVNCISCESKKKRESCFFLADFVGFKLSKVSCKPLRTVGPYFRKSSLPPPAPPPLSSVQMSSVQMLLILRVQSIKQGFTNMLFYFPVVRVCTFVICF